MKVKKGDKVIVIAGKSKGEKGTILKVLKLSNKVLIEGVNTVKKNQKPKRRGEKGQIIEKSLPINASNVMILDPKKNTPTRIGVKKVGDKNVRIAKKSGQEI